MTERPLLSPPTTLASTLEDYEIRAVLFVGRARVAAAKRYKKTPTFAYKDPAEMKRVHEMGALAECATAKALGLYWNLGVGTHGRVADVGFKHRGFEVEVRWSPYPSLKVRRSDPDDRRCVDVVGGPKRFELVGWAYAREAKRPDWLKAPREGPPAYFMPVAYLRPIDDLIEELWGWK